MVFVRISKLGRFGFLVPWGDGLVYDGHGWTHDGHGRTHDGRLDGSWRAMVDFPSRATPLVTSRLWLSSSASRKRMRGSFRKWS